MKASMCEIRVMSCISFFCLLLDVTKTRVCYMVAKKFPSIIVVLRRLIGIDAPVDGYKYGGGNYALDYGYEYVRAE